MYQAIVLCIAAALSAGILLLFRNKDKNKFNTVLKVLAVVFYAVGFCRYFLSDSFIYVINGGWFEDVKYENPDILQSILRWGHSISYAVLPIAVFYNVRFFRNIASYVCLPFAIMTTVFFDDHMEYFLAKNSHGISLTPGLRYTFFILELALAIMIPILLQVGHKHVLDVKNGKEIAEFIIGIPMVALVSIPTYIPQSLFGYNSLIPPAYGSFHLIWLAGLLIACVGLYYLFRFKSREERVALCMFLAILLFCTRNSIYLMGINIKRLPFQLCNIAAYFYAIALVFKREKMFHFAFIANIVGALIAILMPDFSVGTLSFWSMHYLIEHSLVVIVPAMVMGLRIFKRLEFKSLKYTAIGFTIYFLCVFIGGMFLNGISDITGETVNYFYMFDIEVALDFFPFLTFAKDSVVRFGPFEFYPIIVGLIYVLFSLLCFLFYLLIRFCYKLEDDHLALRGSSIDLYEKITHKVSRRPKQFVE